MSELSFPEVRANSSDSSERPTEGRLTGRRETKELNSGEDEFPSDLDLNGLPHAGSRSMEQKGESQQVSEAHTKRPLCKCVQISGKAD